MDGLDGLDGVGKGGCVNSKSRVYVCPFVGMKYFKMGVYYMNMPRL